MELTEFLLARIAEDESAARGEIPESAWGTGVIIPNNPARVLAECEAKRRIVELHKTNGWLDQSGSTLDAIRALAAVYSDHPDYREEWKP